MAAPFDLSQARDADAFERALSGARDVPDEITSLVDTARTLSTLPIPSPDPAFVSSLGTRLQHAAAAPPGPVDTTGLPKNVISIGRSAPRTIAATAAGLVAASAALGLGTQHALPGSPFYGVRGLVDGIETVAAGSAAARGRVELGHAREHIDDTGILAARRPQSAEDIITSLDDAAATVSSGEGRLFDAYGDSRDTADLASVRDFTVWAQPRITDLRSKVPAESIASLDALSATVKAGETRLNATLTACGPRCSGIAPVPSGTPTTPSPTSSPSPTSRSTSTSTTSTPTPMPSRSGPTSPTSLPTTTPPSDSSTAVPQPPGTSTGPEPDPTTSTPRPPAPGPGPVPTTQPPAPVPTTTPPEPTTRPSTTPAPDPTSTRRCPPGHVWDGHDCRRIKTTGPTAPQPPDPKVTPTPTATPSPTTSSPSPTTTSAPQPAPTTPSPTSSSTSSPAPTPTPTTPPLELRCTLLRLFLGGLEPGQLVSMTWHGADPVWRAHLVVRRPAPFAGNLNLWVGPLTTACKTSLGG